MLWIILIILENFHGLYRWAKSWSLVRFLSTTFKIKHIPLLSFCLWRLFSKGLLWLALPNLFSLFDKLLLTNFTSSLIFFCNLCLWIKSSPNILFIFLILYSDLHPSRALFYLSFQSSPLFQFRFISLLLNLIQFPQSFHLYFLFSFLSFF